VPNRRQEERSASREETEEEDDHQRMLVVHEVVAQPRATIRNAPIREFDVELAQGGGNVYDEEAVEEAYWRVPSFLVRAQLRNILN
jgi:hypothetical protein